MPTTSSGGVDIYYEVHGDGPPVLFVHGAGGNHAIWWQQLAALGHDHTVVTMDLRGFGNSDSSLPEFDARDFPRDVVAVLDDADLADVMVVGQSIGAAAALRAGLDRPDRIGGVVLAHSLGGIDNPELNRLVAADRAKAEKLPVIDRLMSRSFQEEAPAKVTLFRQLGTFNVATMQDLRNLTSGGPVVEEVAAAPLFLAFLAGGRDAVLGPATVRRAHELVPGSHLEVVPDGPHSMYWEVPDMFNDAIVRLRTLHSAQEVTR